MTPDQLKAHLAAAAADLGFARFGVAPAADLPAHQAAFEAWLAAEHDAGMEYMRRHRELRASPARLVPGAQSVVCVLVDYRGVDPAPPGPPGEAGVGGKVARYARVRDYHIVLRKRLKALAARLTAARPGAQVKVCVDSAPLLERAYAWRAGLGFVGKNGMLITPGLGSYTLLGSLVTDVALPPDQPGEGTCGRCTRCLEGCPTGAFPEPGVLDARRCISYWTIEHRGPLPDDAALHGWAFGCDVCQEVCPYNYPEAAPLELGPDFDSPRAVGARFGRDQLAGVEDRDGYRERFAGTPLMRAGVEGMRRNLDQLAAEGFEV